MPNKCKKKCNKIWTEYFLHKNLQFLVSSLPVKCLQMFDDSSCTLGRQQNILLLNDILGNSQYEEIRRDMCLNFKGQKTVFQWGWSLMHSRQTLQISCPLFLCVKLNGPIRCNGLYSNSSLHTTTWNKLRTLDKTHNKMLGKKKHINTRCTNNK